MYSNSWESCTVYKNAVKKQGYEVSAPLLKKIPSLFNDVTDAAVPVQSIHLLHQTT